MGAEFGRGWFSALWRHFFRTQPSPLGRAKVQTSMATQFAAEYRPADAARNAMRYGKELTAASNYG
jgi:hypothetical protein